MEGPYRAEERIERPIGLVWSGYIPSATHAQRALQTSMGLSQYTRRKVPNSSEDICLFLLDILTLLVTSDIPESIIVICKSQNSNETIP